MIPPELERRLRADAYNPCWMHLSSSQDLRILLAEIDLLRQKGAKMDQQQIENIFTYHKPTGNQPTRYEVLRAGGKILAESVNELCPESREKSLAITHIQQAIMWANAAIAINEEEI